MPHRIEWSQRSRIREALRRDPLVHVAAPLLDPAQLIELIAELGRLEPQPRRNFWQPGAPEIMVVGNVRDENGRIVGANAIGQGLHSDGSYRKNPAELTVLYALAVPARGGDTEFYSLYRLYDDLDEATREAWARLEVRHATNSAYFDDDPDRSNLHPLVQRHPDTGRLLVYASPAYAQTVLGIPESESRAILGRIAASLEPPDVVHRWRAHDLLIWDNRALAHRATEYDQRERRHLWRLSVHLDHRAPEAHA